MNAREEFLQRVEESDDERRVVKVSYEYSTIVFMPHIMLESSANSIILDHRTFGMLFL